ncbi:unnamed protein product [Closterium sp. NIES-64]|nr:unnamed protein product [Closterium sp. NIES-64]
MPKMTSSWLSSQLAHGAKVSTCGIRAAASGGEQQLSRVVPTQRFSKSPCLTPPFYPPQIHVRHQNSGFWWRAADGKTWSGSVATSSDFDQPDVSQALTVIRVSATTVSLGMCMCMFLPVGEGVMEGDEGEIIHSSSSPSFPTPSQTKLQTPSAAACSLFKSPTIKLQTPCSTFLCKAPPSRPTDF